MEGAVEKIEREIQYYIILHLYAHNLSHTVVPFEPGSFFQHNSLSDYSGFMNGDRAGTWGMNMMNCGES